MSDRLAELVAVRETLYGPYWRAWLMRALRGKHHGCGKVKCCPGCNQRGRWLIGKPLLRLTSKWPLRLIWTIGAGHAAR